ncbi:MAG: hypothetical protein ABSD20_07495 [Terriglobales bacterium]|jgi:hypothetical protein
MFDVYLVNEKSTVTAKGDGPLVDISAAGNRIFLLQLNITAAVEQESLDVSVQGEPDEKGAAKTLGAFPQLFYPGQHSILLDLSNAPAVHAMRAHWEVNRWGRGPETPQFEFGLKATEVSPAVLGERQAQGKASSR